MKTTIEQQISDRVDMFKPIPNGEQEWALGFFGLWLRAIYRLTGDELESALLEANRKRCLSPLEKSEVADIRSRVDRAPVSRYDLLVRMGTQQALINRYLG